MFTDHIYRGPYLHAWIWGGVLEIFQWLTKLRPQLRKMAFALRFQASTAGCLIVAPSPARVLGHKTLPKEALSWHAAPSAPPFPSLITGCCRSICTLEPLENPLQSRRSTGVPVAYCAILVGWGWEHPPHVKQCPGAMCSLHPDKGLSRPARAPSPSPENLSLNGRPATATPTAV